MAAVQEGNVSASEEQYAVLESQRRTMLPGWIINNDRLLGLLATTMGKLDLASAHFEDALEFCRNAGYRPELAWACHDYAEALLVGGIDVSRRPARSGDGQAKVSALLSESLAISKDLGMRPLMKRVAGLQDTPSAPPTPRSAFPDGLTEREVEVIKLVAGGKTDREIAEELIISINTVGNHVRSILNKTNSANRTEAAHYASQQGLVD